MHRGLFITGTDTGVGKTRAACALAHALASRGLPVHARKPVESGCAESADGLVPADAAALRAAAGGQEPLARVNAIRLRAPLSPERAAALEGVRYDIEGLAGACTAGVGDQGLLLVEGAGGFYSPIGPGALNADLATRLGLPVLLVAADRLGVINHVLLTIEAIRQRGLELAGVVLSEPHSAGTDPAMDNRGELERWTGIQAISLPYGGAAGPDAWASESHAFGSWIDARFAASATAA
ncbi:dethiobiotin synthase [Lysobacter humi (ex Lee et al. 2017)]